MSWDVLVIANPVWETARLVDRIPGDPTPGSMAGRDAGTGKRDDHLNTGHRGDNPEVVDGGGSALNTACALAMAGRRVIAVGRVGGDDEGHACIEALRRRGVETACEILLGRTTKRNTCLVDRISCGVAFSVDLPERSVPPWEETPGMLLQAGILLLDRLAAPAPAWLATRTAARVAGAGEGERNAPHDASESVNALVRNSAILSPAGRERLRSAMPHLGYLQVPEEPDLRGSDAKAGGAAASPALPGVAPAADLMGAADNSIAFDRSRIHRPQAHPALSDGEVAGILGAGVRWLVRTRGARGIILHAVGRPAVEVPAIPTPIVDPTGAGDAFAAGFLDAILDGEAPEAAALRGVEWAARACRYLGARGWLDHEPPGRG